jgi:hypothetical protein
MPLLYEVLLTLGVSVFFAVILRACKKNRNPTAVAGSETKM